MNKIVLGGILVTMAGGIPGATYLLTRDSEDKSTSSRKERSEVGEVSQSPASSDGSSSCSSPCVGAEDNRNRPSGGSEATSIGR